MRSFGATLAEFLSMPRHHLACGITFKISRHWKWSAGLRCWPLLYFILCLSALDNHAFRNQFYRHPDQQRQDEQVVEMPSHRHEVRDQINWRNSIRYCDTEQHF